MKSKHQLPRRRSSLFALAGGGQRDLNDMPAGARFHCLVSVGGREVVISACAADLRRGLAAGTPVPFTDAAGRLFWCPSASAFFAGAMFASGDD